MRSIMPQVSMTIVHPANAALGPDKNLHSMVLKHTPPGPGYQEQYLLLPVLEEVMIRTENLRLVSSEHAVHVKWVSGSVGLLVWVGWTT